MPTTHTAHDRRTVFLYPGQGGRPEGLPPPSWRTNRLFQIAASHGIPLSDWLREGRIDRLEATEHAQPAILIDSLARDATLQQAGLRPSYVAGHSLGEYAALVAAGVLVDVDALELVIERGRLMGKAPGGMAAIVKLDLKTVAALCAEVGPGVVVANHNSPRQIAVSGLEAAVEQVMERSMALGGRGIRLKVAGPFHSPLLRDAEDALAARIDRVPFRPPRIHFVSSVTGEIENDPDRIRSLMKTQMTSCVQWVDVIERLAREHAPTAVEVGSGSVLTNLGKRITEAISFLTFEEVYDAYIR